MFPVLHTILAVESGSWILKTIETKVSLLTQCQICSTVSHQPKPFYFPFHFTKKNPFCFAVSFTFLLWNQSYFHFIHEMNILTEEQAVVHCWELVSLEKYSATSVLRHVLLTFLVKRVLTRCFQEIYKQIEE